jgi:hypothetical protein
MCLYDIYVRTAGMRVMKGVLEWKTKRELKGKSGFVKVVG